LLNWTIKIIFDNLVMITLISRPLRAIALSILLSATCMPIDGFAEDAPNWAALARQDLQFAADTIASRHAGVVDGQPSVTGPLTTGLRLALADVDAVHNEQDYLRLLTRFIAGFGDPHTAIDLHLTTRGWTGIILDQIDGRYRVIWSEPGWPNALPPAGAVAESCDGVYTGTYLQLKVGPFVNRRAEYSTALSSLAQQSMFDTGLGWTPAQCVFALADGSVRRFALPLRPVPEQVSQARLNALRPLYHAAAKPVGVIQLGPGRYWVGMPTFNGKYSGAAYEALYPKLAALNQPAWVVLDLRGNGGGDSSWGTRALGALYGTAYSSQLEKAGGEQEYLIADNVTVNQLKRYIAAPEFANSRDYLVEVLEKVRGAIEAGSKMALVSGRTDAPTADVLPARVVRRPHGPRLAAIIDRGCFSSCMNVLQQIRATGDAVVLGEPTIGYSPFGEISRIDLPSRRGALLIPSAVFRTAQATRQPFLPDYTFSGKMTDDNALTTWVNRILDDLTVSSERKAF
jgi:hypothetical protein